MDTSEIFRENLRLLFSHYKTQMKGSQKTLAKIAGVQQGQVSVWLSGGYLPGIESLDAIAKAFGVSVEVFFQRGGAAKALGTPLSGGETSRNGSAPNAAVTTTNRLGDKKQKLIDLIRSPAFDDSQVAPTLDWINGNIARAPGDKNKLKRGDQDK